MTRTRAPRRPLEPIAEAPDVPAGEVSAARRTQWPNGAETYCGTTKRLKGYTVYTARHTYDAFTVEGEKLGSGTLAHCFNLLDGTKARAAALSFAKADAPRRSRRER